MPSVMEENLICPNCGNSTLIVSFDHLNVLASVIDDQILEFDWNSISDLNDEDIEIIIQCDNSTCNFERRTVFDWSQE